MIGFLIHQVRSLDIPVHLVSRDYEERLTRNPGCDIRSDDQHFHGANIYLPLRAQISVDILTHGIAVSLLLAAANAGTFLLPGILGAISPDLDAMFFFARPRDPRRYILIHGGFTHSIAGGFLAALIAFGIALVVAAAIPPVREAGIVLSAGALIALFTGTLLHLCLDILATPGIPVLYPVSDRKYTFGIFPGPSMVVFGLSILFLLLFFSGLIGPEGFVWYAVIFFAFVIASTVVKIAVAARTTGKTIPTLNPLEWMVIDESPEAYLLSSYHIFRGSGNEREFPKFSGVTPKEALRFRDRPEIRRLVYNSYIVTVERDGSDIVFRDPLRTGGTIFYPPYFSEERIPLSGSPDIPSIL